MSFEQLAHRYEPITTKRFFLPQDWHHSPQSLRPSIQDMIQKGIDTISRDDMTAVFHFRIPGEAHVLPLFQKEFFDALVREHNTWTETEYYIHPFTLMMFDPALSGMQSKPRHFHSLQGEDAVLHELRHFWALQELWKQNTTGQIGFHLKWEDYPKKHVQFLTTGGFFGTDEEINSQDGIVTSWGPLYPSSADNKLIQEDFADLTWMSKLKKKVLWGNMQTDKMMEQGLKSKWLSALYNPVSPDGMLSSLFGQWMELRKNEIDFEKWKPIFTFKK